jgi:hypothetical protein
MIKTITIYGDDGKKLGEMAACDCKPIFLWRDVAWGVGVALAVGMFIFG